jgi:hypothetical protein
MYITLHENQQYLRFANLAIRKALCNLTELVDDARLAILSNLLALLYLSGFRGSTPQGVTELRDQGPETGEIVREILPMKLTTS